MILRDFAIEKKRIVTDPTQLAIVCTEVEADDEALAEKDKIVKDLLCAARTFAKYHPAGCAGLAANQLGYDKRIFVIKTSKGWVPFINPTFTPCGTMAWKDEGCLSFPNRTMKAKRFGKVYAKSAFRNKRILLSGFEAQAFQHELNHLDGVLV